MTAPDLEELARELEELRFERFDLDTAWRLGCILREMAVADALPVRIEISVAGNVLFATALPGTSPDNAEWVRRKRNTVMRFHRSSLALRLECEARGVGLGARFGLDERDFAASGGGVPIATQATGIIGAAVVSGLPDVEDHRLLVRAMRTLRAEQTGQAPA
ncbi:heme-degrading domain-containing protein [Antarcticirhabdus aurantiaca]|uniref:Heme-degrading domain-containing protein n=1 Tax=Antarcticirhabdus aurantiaca TaxID=2606717 RepID=A0ACD4NH64_9HYPH|nr:heme-degrading domain-containing protein [Antarcticirhabdus aurantiaca]WAJ26143.1 heme-degrading domain-containing protein [Jeongeuplla avenae]